MTETPVESSICVCVCVQVSLSSLSLLLVRIARRAFLTFSVHYASRLEFSLPASTVSLSLSLLCLTSNHIIFSLEREKKCEKEKNDRKRLSGETFLVQCSITISFGLAVTKRRKMINYSIEYFTDQHSFIIEHSVPVSRLIIRIKFGGMH